ncbi:alpha/beta hydrolase [Mucilaginibacter achroorhodeus]|uniref:Alpha/beta hydrolase n=1 Tax=Mucilaginibacter achroorhodeus TaxID=2599294 RepID=A0A563UAL9_9SPHI|nr:alpha/beta hydrolase [Mucilaginibacter achroorhodeus]TWR28384.1 alpha/beta hydrolase [Mucilaginibacter achroorhodeus]
MKRIALLMFMVLSMLSTAAIRAQDIRKMMDTTKYGRNPAVGKYANIRGIKMYYEVYGKGEPLLIIHGNGGSINNFLFQIPYFAKKYQVILADSRAQGKTVDSADSLSYEMITDDLNGLLEHLKIKNANVIGWSDGGIEGLLLAMRHPDKVNKLAVTGANLRPDTTAVDPFVQKMVLAENIKGADSLKKMKNPPAEMKNQLKLMHLLSYEPNIKTADLKKISCPVLVIGGDHDVITTRHTLEIFENIPKAYLWILPNSGHSTPIFYRDMFNQVVSDFFAKPYRSIEKTARFN